MEAGVENLRAENERLVAEMATLKKKIKLAMKKQQAELQSRIHAAETRAAAAEAAAVSMNGSSGQAISQIDPPRSPVSCSNGALEPDSPQSLGSSLSGVEGFNGEIPRYTSLVEMSCLKEGIDGAQGDVEDLKTELDRERTKSHELEEAARKGRQRLEAEVLDLRTSMQALELQKDSTMLAVQAELEQLKEESRKSIEHLSKTNEKLETQLMGAAEQVADAFSRISSTHDDMERISKQGHEAKRAYSSLATEHESTCKELEETRAALAEAQKELLQKEREMEDIAASRKVAQEGQEAAVTQLMQRLDEMETLRGQPSEELSSAIILELRSQNESLLLQIEKLQSQVSLHHNFQEDKQAQYLLTSVSLGEFQTIKNELANVRASENTAKELAQRQSIACKEVEERYETLSMELVKVCSEMEKELKMRDDKYAELDSKFGRLQKRAKQRIQEVQKEKEDVEARLTALATVQEDLDRTRVQAAEALRALDNERQQLRSANIKLKEEGEELRRTLEAREHNLAESRRLASEKDQNALEMSALSAEIEAKHEASVSELKEQFQKVIEDLKAQLIDGTIENSKMGTQLLTLKAQLADKESKLAALEVASSGEVARLGASLEAAKGELSRLEQEHRTEQEAWQANIEKMKKKWKESEKTRQQLEASAAEIKGQLESELQGQLQAFNAAQAEIVQAQDETARLGNELAAYKVRAYALLQKKEAELLAAKDSDLVAAQKLALKEATRAAAVAVAEKENALQALKDAVSEYDLKLAARDAAVIDAEQRIRDLATKLESTKGLLLSQHDEWLGKLQQIEATWLRKCEALEVKLSDTVESFSNNKLTILTSDYEHVKEEYDSFREMADRMIEEKDKEIVRLLDDNTALQKALSAQAQVKNEDCSIDDEKPDPHSIVAVAVAEQQILLLARQQAQREEEVTQCRRHIQALQEEITELEHENRLHSQQEAMLKEEFRKLERAQKRDGVDMTYLKNVILKLLETGEVEALLPVVAMLLQFNPDELKRCHDSYSQQAADVGGAPAVVDASATGPRSFFSRLAFSR